MNEAPPSEDEALVFECDLDDPPAKVWRAISDPELRAAWLGEAEAETSEVIETSEGERLVLDWPGDGLDGQVSFEIGAAEGGGTHLRIVHSVRAPTCKILEFPAGAARRTVMAAAGYGLKWAA